MRADADYVCYTEGQYDCKKLRNHLLSQRYLLRPIVYSLPQPSVYGDFWHTGCADEATGRRGGSMPAGLGLEPFSTGMPRIYRVFPGMRFARLGRWEGVRMNRLMRRLKRHVRWPTPIWMHCSIKSDENFLYRGERTNWRELGDYDRFPTLHSYLCSTLQAKYGSADLQEAMRILMNERFFARLVRYDPENAYPYPTLVRKVMNTNPIYKIRNGAGGLMRDYSGPVDVEMLADFAKSARAATRDGPCAESE